MFETPDEERAQMVHVEAGHLATNPAYQRHLDKFLRLLDWARS